tara:strand:- start:865 stop:1110 length:246 start_codon:yes stop_codon:yes gene_type:complete
MNRNYVRRNITTITIIIYIILYSVVVILKPAFVYNDDGSLRNFGIGYKKKTVIPIWLVSICLAIISYFTVLCYLTYPKLIE